MKNNTNRKTRGNKLYTAYRRIRYISFLRKKAKKRKKALKNQEKLEKNEIKKKIKEKTRNDKKQDKIRKKNLKSVQKSELAQLKVNLKTKSEQDKEFNKSKLLQIKQEKREDKKQKKLYRQQYTKENLRTFFHDIRNFDRHTLKRWFSFYSSIFSNKEKRKDFITITLNSLGLFVLSYLVLFGLSQIITIWVSLSFEYKTIWYYYKIFYNIESSDWTADSVKILFSIPPLTGLLFGTIALIFYNTIKNETGFFKLFFLWVFVHGMVMFFGSLLMGTLLNKGFGWVIAYMYYRDTGKMVFAILSIFALFSAGGIVSKSFLISGNTYFNFIDKQNRKFFFFAQVLFPLIIGTVLLSFIKIPDNFYYITSDEVTYEILKLLTIVFVLISLAASFSSTDEIFFDEESRKIRINWKYLLIAAVLFLAIRFSLIDGYEFG